MNKMTFGLASLLLAGVAGGCIGVGAAHMPAAHASTTEATGDTVTVFVDATFGFRKDHMARKLTESHAKYAALGYHFADLEAYDENGDLQGFFVTYTRQ